MEDFEPLQRMLVQVLSSDEHNLLAAADAAEALCLAEAHPGSVDLLITDIVLPGMRGPELASRLRACWPEMKIIYTPDASSPSDRTRR